MEHSSCGVVQNDEQRGSNRDSASMRDGEA